MPSTAKKKKGNDKPVRTGWWGCIKKNEQTPSIPPPELNVPELQPHVSNSSDPSSDDANDEEGKPVPSHSKQMTLTFWINASSPKPGTRQFNCPQELHQFVLRFRHPKRVMKRAKVNILANYTSISWLTHCLKLKRVMPDSLIPATQNRTFSQLNR